MIVYHGHQRFHVEKEWRPHPDLLAGQPAVAPESPDTLTLATYNVENMFGPTPDPGKTTHDQPPKSAESMAAAAEVIRETHADAVALQEVNHEKMLNTFLDTYLKDDPYPYRILIPGNDERGIDVAVISKYPIVHAVSHKDDRFPVRGQSQPQGFSRDLLEATIKKGAYEFTVKTTHLKSHRGGQEANDKRLAEAQQIHRIDNDDMQAYPGKKFVVCGDFNDTEDTATVRSVVGQGQPNALLDPMAGSDEWTHPRSRNRIDFMLLSPGMARDYIPGSAHAFKSPSGREASDHRPVVEKFSIR